MKGSRILAVGLVSGAAVGIAAGYFLPRDSVEGKAAVRPSEEKTQPPFRVEVTSTKVVDHNPALNLSGRTEADHRVALSARTGGVLSELRVKRGQYVKKGDV